ncbi:MAG: hypothetical protein JXB60_06330 [Candidatus Cloacimonetes bacterium]|nr:hypothetical protein [Candidatus Cloacimonadota bacterium]
MIRFLLLITLFGSASVLGCAFGSVFNISSNSVDEEDNIISNSSFENIDFEAQKLPASWYILSERDDLIILDSSVCHTGNSSIMVKSPETEITLVSAAFEIDPTCIYYSRCFVRSDDRSTQPLTLYLFAFDIAGNPVNTFSRKIFPTENWAKLDFTSAFFKSSAKVGRIAINIPEKENVSFWIDDAESYRMHRFAFSQE